MSDETKTPQPGEWWRANSSGENTFVCGFDSEGDPVVEFSEMVEHYKMQTFIDRWHHEPRCTGFDWVEPPAVDPGEGYELLPVGTVLQAGDEFDSGGTWMTTCYPETKCIAGWTYRRKIKPAEVWPKWYVLDETQGSCEHPWYIKRTSETEWFRYGKCYDGTIGFEEQNAWPKLKPVLWMEVTESEALARVTPPETRETIAQKTIERVKRFDPASVPVESPDDWVEITDPEHVLRKGIDQVLESGFSTHRWAVVELSEGIKAGQSGYVACRCRRKNLPAKLTPFADELAAKTTAARAMKEQPAMKRVRVRLWCPYRLLNEGGSYQLRVTHADETYGSWYEILHDADGFYVEAEVTE
jgi:hypothetical protein